MAADKLVHIQTMHPGIIFNYRLLGSLIDMYVSQQTPPSKLERLAALNPQARVKELFAKETER